MATLSSLPVGSKVKITHSIIGDIPCIVAAQNHDGYPSNSTTLITEKIILLRAFDAKEPNNSDSDRKKYGNNKYSVSNLDQWLNSSAAAGQWYSARHSADQAPDNTNVLRNPYDTDAGFLAGFDAAFVAALKDTTLKVALNTVTDGGSYESVTRKFFLPSRAELFGEAENSIMEGSLLSYFSANTDAVRIAQLSAYAAQDNANKGSSSVTAGSKRYYWLRTPYPSISCFVCCVDSDGRSNVDNAFNGHFGVRPLCNLDSGISVSDSTDSDGCYSLVFQEPMTLRQSVEQHITDAYTAISNKSGTIPTQKNLANLAGAIGTISTGVDTSDATATSADILKDKTAYVKGAKVTGAIETYDGTAEDVSQYQVTVTNSNQNNSNVEDIIVYETDILSEDDYGTLLGYVSSNQTAVFTVTKKYIVVRNTYDSVDAYSGGLTKVKTYTSGTYTDWFEVSGDGTITAEGYYCLTGDTLITLADGTEKRIDELTLQDKVLAIDTETGKLVADEITYTDSTEHKTYTEYDVWTFSDAIIVKTVHRHRFYNVEKQAMVYMDEWNIGEHAVNQNGEYIALVSHENAKEEVQHYTIFTKHQNYFANGLLSGNRYTAELHL